MHEIADDPQNRLHKGSEAEKQSVKQVGSTLPAGPDAACTAFPIIQEPEGVVSNR
jgi:hypothetical protein